MKLSGSDTESAFWTHAEGLEIQIVLAWKLRLRDRHESVRAGAVAMLDETALREARYSAISLHYGRKLVVSSNIVLDRVL